MAWNLQYYFLQMGKMKVFRKIFSRGGVNIPIKQVLQRPQYDITSVKGMGIMTYNKPKTDTVEHRRLEKKIQAFKDSINEAYEQKRIGKELKNNFLNRLIYIESQLLNKDALSGEAL